MIARYLDCGPRERLRRIAVVAIVAAVVYVPGFVTLAMLLSGNA
jgi:hypothetical protein